MPSKMSPRSPFHRAPLALRVEASDASTKIMLYDEIGFWGVTAKDFVAELSKISTRTIDLHINSPGGDVFDGLAIANALREHDARVITHVDGLAASIASVIALAGDYVRMSDNSFLMIHDPFMITMGDAVQLRKDADTLEKIGGSIVGEYVKRSGQERSVVEAWMRDETWFSAAEAESHGFVDAIDHAADATKDAAPTTFDLSIFEHAPAALVATLDPTVRKLERAAQDAGLSRREARRLVAAYLVDKDAPSEREPEPSAVDWTSVSEAGERLLAAMR